MQRRQGQPPPFRLRLARDTALEVISLGAEAVSALFNVAAQPNRLPSVVRIVTL
jgi:hypothetical protein